MALKFRVEGGGLRSGLRRLSRMFGVRRKRNSLDIDGMVFGVGGEERPQPGRRQIKRDQGGHERWADAILPADAEAGTLETPTNRRPLVIIVALVVLASGVLGAQLFSLQIANGERNLGLAEGNRIRAKITRAPRGVIYDRQKQILARNEASFDVTVIPSLLPRDNGVRQAAYVKAGELLGISVDEIVAKAEGDCIKRTTSPKIKPEVAQSACLLQTQPQLVKAGVERQAALIFDQETSNLPGFSLDQNPIRQYLDGGLFSAILGYTGRVSPGDLSPNAAYLPTDFIGKQGIERFYEQDLRGQNGSEQTEVDATGRPVKLLTSRPAIAGSNLLLALDSELQRKLTEAIQGQLSASGSTKGAGIAINPKNGEVLAAVNMPSYDNNLFAAGISQKEYDRLAKDPNQPLFNKVTAGAYPTGSIIKPLIGSAALQERVVSPSTSVEDKGQLEVTNKYDPNIKYTFRSYEPGGLGVVNMVRALALSSNVYFFTVGGGYGNIAGLGVDKLTSYYQKFGLGKKSNIDIPEQTAGRVPTPAWKKKVSGEPWVLGDTYNISVGQGDLLASPLQMAVATAAIAGNGDVLKPHFVRSVLDSNGNPIRTIGREVVQKSFISPENLNVIRSGMRQVVTSGTACCKLQEEVPVPVAAKTGTAETGPNGKRKPHAWFSAYAPYDDPQIVIVVLIENSGEGSQYAAPAVREVLAWCFRRPEGCVN